MKAIVFAYHDIGCAGIKALLNHGYDIVQIYTHTDNPGETIWFDSVAELAAENKIPVHAPEDVNHPIWIEKIKLAAPDIIFSFYYRNILGKEILDIPLAGCFNLHGSLLPAYRRCPVNWVLVNGETQTGVTLHCMETKADAGDIVAQKKIDISSDDTALTLHHKSALATSELLDEVLLDIKNGTASHTIQDASMSSCFGGRRPEDGEIDWTLPAQNIRNLVRAVTKPYPGAYSHRGDNKVFFWKVSVIPFDNSDVSPGSITSTEPLAIACGKDAIEVEAAQTESGPYMVGHQFAHEECLSTGMRFGRKISIELSEKEKKMSLYWVSTGLSAMP